MNVNRFCRLLNKISARYPGALVGPSDADGRRCEVVDSLEQKLGVIDLDEELFRAENGLEIRP